jgi:hypothetical protein
MLGDFMKSEKFVGSRETPYHVVISGKLLLVEHWTERYPVLKLKHTFENELGAEHAYRDIRTVGDFKRWRSRLEVLVE